MTVDDAGKYYLATVCPANVALKAYNAAFAAQDLSTIKQTAGAARDASRAEASALLNTDVQWPAVVSPADLKLLTDADFADMSNLDSVAASTTLASANATSAAYADNGAAAASQRIRLELNLPANTSAGC